MLSLSFLVSSWVVTTRPGMPFLTPDKTAGDTTRSFTIPAYFVPFVVGALLDALDCEAWEVKGDATIQECLELLSSVIAQIEEV